MPVRRRSPQWVRDMRSEGLHRLGARLQTEYRTVGITERQEAVWDAVVSELDYRNRRRHPMDRCTCLLCSSPFPDGPMCVEVVRERLEAVELDRRARA